MLFCVFESINRLPIGDFSAIAFSSPVFTMILSTFLLKERCGLYRISVAILLISGVIVLTRPTVMFGAQITTIVDRTTHPSQTHDASISITHDYVQKVGMVGIILAVTTAMLSASISIVAR